ncbi:MAG: hypothetical protein JNN08_20755 [Bryobacterales bacterium]|nr:hypothetical protein [Bryobacterales bacterium]
MLNTRLARLARNGFVGLALVSCSLPQALAQQSPSREYIRLGSRVIAIEGQAQGSQVTVRTDVAGASFSVDGVSKTSETAFAWAAGSAHTIATTDLQTPSSGTRYRFKYWLDSSTSTQNTSLSFSYTAPTGGQATAVTFTAHFDVEYELAVSATGKPQGVSFTLNPPGGWYKASSEAVSVTATIPSGSELKGWTGISVSGAANPVTVPALTAPVQLVAIVGDPSDVTVSITTTVTNGSAFAGKLRVTNMSTNVSTELQPTPGSAVVVWSGRPDLGTKVLIEPIDVESNGSRTAFMQWVNLSNCPAPASRSSQLTPTTNVSCRIDYTWQHRLTTIASPSHGGTVSPSGVNWFNAGQVVQVGATAASGYVFQGWAGVGSGSVSSTQANISVTMSGPITETATFVIPYQIRPSIAGLRAFQSQTFSVNQPATWTAVAVSGSSIPPQGASNTATFTYLAPSVGVMTEVLITATSAGGTSTARLFISSTNIPAQVESGFSFYPTGQQSNISGNANFIKFKYTNQEGLADLLYSQQAVGFCGAVIFDQTNLNPQCTGGGGNTFGEKCYTTLYRETGVLALADDTGNNFIGMGELGSATTLENSYCSVDLSRSVLVATDDVNSYLMLHMLLKQSLLREGAPSRWVHAKVFDHSGAPSPWRSLNTWETKRVTPNIIFRDPWNAHWAARRGETAGRSAGGILPNSPNVSQGNMGQTYLIGTDDYLNVYANRFDSSSLEGAAPSWLGWSSGGGLFRGVPAVAATPFGTAFVVARDTYYGYWVTSLSQSGSSLVFSGWTLVGGTFEGDPVAAVASDGTTYFAGRNIWGAVDFRSFRYANASQWPNAGTWDNWNALGAPLAGDPVLVAGRDNAAYLFIRNTSGDRVIVRRFQPEVQAWGTFRYAQPINSVDIRAAASNGKIYVVARTASNDILYNIFLEGEGENWQGWVQLTKQMDFANVTVLDGRPYIVGRDLTGGIWWYDVQANSWSQQFGGNLTRGRLGVTPQ